MNSNWKWRSMISFFLLFAGIALSLSGIVLFAAPPGWLANAGWTLLGLDKGQWEAIHTIFGYATIVFAVLHLILNWKVLLNYLRDRARRVYRLKLEFLAALAFALLLGLGAAMQWPPFSNVMNLGETLSQRWESGATVAPTVETPPEHEATGGVTGGWGRYTVAALCAQYDVPLAEGLARLNQAGIQAQAESNIRLLANDSGREPSEIAGIIAGNN